MSADPKARARTLALGRLAREADEVLRRIEAAFPAAPRAMAWFHEVHRRVFVRGEPPEASGPLVGLTCVQVPLELVHAVGARPVRLCGGAQAWEPAGADFVPAKGCPLVRSTLGMLAVEALPGGGRPAVVVAVATCDQKRKAGEVVEALGYRVHHLALPSSTSAEAGREAWRHEVALLAEALSAVTGRRLTRAGLAGAARRLSEARRAYRRLHDHRAGPAPGLSGTEVLLVASALGHADLEAWTAAVDALADELAARPERPTPGPRRLRLLLTGSPPIFPNLKLPLLVEEAGALVVVDEACSSGRLLHDAVYLDEGGLYDMIPALADRYLKPCTCPIFTSGADRRRRLVELAAAFGVDGAVYQTFTGCHPYEMEQRGVRTALDGVGVPTLFVETDYSPEDAGQLGTRVEAFLEAARARAGRS